MSLEENRRKFELAETQRIKDACNRWLDLANKTGLSRSEKKEIGQLRRLLTQEATDHSAILAVPDIDFADVVLYLRKSAIKDFAHARMAAPAHEPDGIVGPKSFRLGGHTFTDLTPIEIDMLKFLWSKGTFPEALPREVKSVVYGDGHQVTLGTVNTHKKSLSKKLFSQSCGRWQVKQVQGKYKLTSVAGSDEGSEKLPRI